MGTEVIRIDAKLGGGDVFRRAAEVLARGGLVAFPTETVYGVGARADIAAGVARLREIKSRQADQAFTVHLGSPEDAPRFAPALEGLACRLMRKAWPGPLTLIVTVADLWSAPVMCELNGSAAQSMYYDGTIGLRCPDDRIATGVLQAAGAPVVAASANQASHPSPRTGKEVLEQFDGRIDLLIDAGETRYAKPSTIVQVSGTSYKVVREGVYDAGIIERLSKLRVLLVCTGNTCRSPMAAALAEKMLAERLGCSPDDLQGRGVEVRSAGTAGGYGGASPHAVAVLARRGIDLAGHESAALTKEMAEEADYIFAMTKSHCDTIVKMAPLAAQRVAMLLEEQDVLDPIGGSRDDYEQCARTVEEGLKARLGEVIV